MKSKKRAPKKHKKAVKVQTKKSKSMKRLSEELSVRIPSGVQNFDNLIEGGFERGSTNLVVGGAGAGKSIFATQFLTEGMNNGEKCLYITFEEKKPQFYKNMKEFGWDLEKYEKKNLLVFLESFWHPVTP